MRNVWPSSPPLDLQVTKQTPAHSLLYTDWTNQVAKLQSCDIKVLLHLGHCCLQSQLQERATWSPITIKYLAHQFSLKDQSSAATNDYFGNRLVGQLFFRLIGIYFYFFIDKKHTTPHSVQCLSNKHSNWMIYIQYLTMY